MNIVTFFNKLTRRTTSDNTPVYEEITIPTLDEALDILEPLAAAGDTISAEYLSFIEAMVEFEVFQFENALNADYSNYVAEMDYQTRQAAYNAAVNDWLYNDAYRGQGW